MRLSTLKTAVLVLTLSAPASAQPTMPPIVTVRDINPWTAGSSPTELTRVGDLVFFAATDPEHGAELWRTDGTWEGTQLIRDIAPGASSSSPSQLLAMNNLLFFVASDGVSGPELWRSDGTEAGTFLVMDIRTGSTGSSIESFTPAGGVLFFKACDATYGCELWKTDGTGAGTARVKDIMPGFQSAAPKYLVPFGSGVLFAAESLWNGVELWKSDGTAAGTAMVVDIGGPTPSSPGDLANIGDAVFFWATDFFGDRELWKTDGTAGGTVRVKDIRPGNPSSSYEGNSINRIVQVGSRALFTAFQDETGFQLWVSDGTEAGTHILKLGTPWAPEYTTVIQDTAYFSGYLPASGTELWKTDGTAEGTRMVLDLVPGSGSSSPSYLANLNGVLFFAANNGFVNAEPFRSDGTAAGTRHVGQYDPYSPMGANPRYFAALGNQALFAGDAGFDGREVVAVLANVAPVAVAGPDQYESPGATITLDGSGSSDADGQTLTYEWKDDLGAVVGSTVQVVLLPAEGVHVYTLTVSDGAASATDSVRVSLGDSRPINLAVISYEGGLGSVGIDLPPGVCDGVQGESTTCTVEADLESMVTLTAVPSAMSVFTGWSGACSGVSSTCAVTVSGAMHVAATFRGPKILTVQVASVENGVGTVSGWVNDIGGGPFAPFSCDGVAGSMASCTVPVRVGSDVVIEMFSGALSVLDGVVGCSAVPNGPLNSFCRPPVVILDDATFTATFRGPKTLTIQVASVENGIGTVSGWVNDIGGGPFAPFSCDGVAGSMASCTVPVRVGSDVVIEMLGGALSVLDSVVGCSAVPDGLLRSFCQPPVVILDDATFTASFRGPQTLTVQVASVENGIGTVSGWVNDIGGPSTPFTCDGLAGSTTSCAVSARVGSEVFILMSSGALSVLDQVVGCSPSGVDPNFQNYCVPSLMIVDDATVSATFRGPQTLTIQVASIENGIGTVSGFVSDVGGGSSTPFTCDGLAGSTASCTVPVRVGGEVFLEMLSGALSVLDGVVGCSPLAGPVLHGHCVPSLTILDDATVSATFRGPQTLTIQVASVENGIGTVSGQVSDFGAGTSTPFTCDGVAGSTTSCAVPVRVGSDVSIDMLSGALSVLDGVAGCSAVPHGPLLSCQPTLVILDDATLTATFRGPQGMVVTFGGDGSGEVSVASAGACPSAQGTCTFPVSPGSVQQLTASPSADSLFQAWVGACAGQGAVCSLTIADDVSTQAVFALRNHPPVAHPGGPYSGVRNQTITFSGAASNDPDGDPLTYSWDFGDGSAAGTGVAPTHAYATTGTFTVTLTVNDGTVNSAPVTATVTISNQTPTANAGGPYAGTRLGAIGFNGAASSDPDGDALAYSWTFGDGGVATGPAPTYLYTATGTFTVTLVVNDGTASSAPATSTVTIANVAPTVALTSPGSGAVFHAPAGVTVSADAADADGGVAKVEFYAGAVKIGEALGAPYEILWPATVPGAHTLAAVVTDSSGATAASAPVNILINAVPTVALTAPADNAQFAAPASITLTASASDGDGSIAQVQFFRGTTSLGIDNSAPYSVTWTGAAVGSYQLTAVATDNRGAITTSLPITVKVTAALALTADSYVRASSSNSNFGTATALTVQQGSSNSNIRWTYVKFDLTTIPTITNAKVRLFGRVSATTATAINTEVYSVADTSWTETGIKWSNKPATGATALATVAIVNNSTTARWYEFDVTAHLQAEKAAGRYVVTLAFKNLANSTPYVTFTSKEGTAANRPQVVVVP